jgi:hypothetical protein
VFAGERVALSVPGFAAVNVLLVTAWIGVATMLNASRALDTRRTTAA